MDAWMLPWFYTSWIFWINSTAHPSIHSSFNMNLLSSYHLPWYQDAALASGSAVATAQVCHSAAFLPPHYPPDSKATLHITTISQGQRVTGTVFVSSFDLWSEESFAREGMTTDAILAQSENVGFSQIHLPVEGISSPCPQLFSWHAFNEELHACPHFFF